MPSSRRPGRSDASPACCGWSRPDCTSLSSIGVVTVSDEARRQRDVAGPQRLEMQLDGLAVNAHVGEAAARGPGSTGRCRTSAGIPTASMATSTPAPSVSAITFCTALPSPLFTIFVPPRDCAHLEPVLVQVDHHDLGGRVELRGEQRGEPDRPGPDDGDRVSRLHLPVVHAALEPGREDITRASPSPARRRPAGGDAGWCRRAGSGRTRPGSRRSCSRGSNRRHGSASTFPSCRSRTCRRT